MDLIYTTFIPSKRGSRGSSGHEPRRKWLDPTSGVLSSISTVSNVLLFSTTSSLHLKRSEMTGDTDNRFHVYVCDLNTPWDVHCVTTRSFEITALAWDEMGSRVVVADAEGLVEIWEQSESLISSWKCILREKIMNESFIQAKFIITGRKIFLNNEKLESGLYNEKFTSLKPPDVGRKFAQGRISVCVLVSMTGLVLALSFDSEAKRMSATTCLGDSRFRIKHVTMSHLQDGKLVAAVSNGQPTLPIQIFELKPFLKEDQTLAVTADNFSSIFLNNQNKSEEDVNRAIVSVCFVKEYDSDAILIATDTPSGGKVELWEMKTVSYKLHKMFASNMNEGKNEKSIPIWQYVEVFGGPSSQIVSLATPSLTLQMGPSAPCYVTVAYSDGSIQCLLRDSLQQIGSVDVPKAGNLGDDFNSSKMSPILVNISSMSFTATGNALVALDSFGQLYLYRMSPITDPGGPHTAPYLVTLFEHCLVSGNDFWDLTICTKAPQIDSICGTLSENFEKQTNSIKQYYYARFMSIKMTLFSLSVHSEYKASDCNTLLMLNSIDGAFKALLRTADSSSNISEKNIITYEKLARAIDNKKDETDVDHFVTMLQSVQQEFLINPAAIPSLRHLIQWAATLALHLLSTYPDYKNQKGPLTEILADAKVLGTLRQLLLLTRLWSKISRENFQPVFTKTDDSIDIVSTLFNLITKLYANPNDETIQDECLKLPSQVMIPPLNADLRPRGVSPAVVTHNKAPISYEYTFEPDDEISPLESSFIDCVSTNNRVIDCVRQTYLGKKPVLVKQCTRSHGISALSQTSGGGNVEKFWDSRWLRHSPYGGNWQTRRKS